MKSLLLAFLALFVATALPVSAQTKSDEEVVRTLPQAFANAWAKHDGHELAKIMADDVDFVTVGATWLHGRPDFEKYHSGSQRSHPFRQPCAFCVRTLPSFTGAGPLRAIRTRMATSDSGATA